MSKTREDGETTEEKEAPTTRRGAEALVEGLKQEGVDTMFGITGGAVMPVYDALYDDEDIDHIMMGHEQGAAHAAEAYHSVTGRPGVCLATSGPGATNLITGLADADMDSRSIIAVTGQVPTEMIGNDAFQETDMRGVSMPVTKHNYLVKDEDEVPDTVQEAFYVSNTGRPGPVVVDMPKDVSKNDTDAVRGELNIEGYSPNYEGHPRQVKKAAEAIEGADKPLIFAGGGAIMADAADEVRELANENRIPVTTSLQGLGGFPEDNDLSLGMLGMHGTGYANRAVTDCDLLIGIGVRFDDRATGKIESFAPSAEVIHVDIDPAEISKNIHADIPIVGDAKRVVGDINDEMASHASPDTEDWLDTLNDWREKYPMEYEQEDGELKPQYVIEELDDRTPDDTIVCTGVGQHQMWAAQWYEYNEPRTWISSGGLGTMGCGLPMTIGAKLAAPDKEVVCIDGDGSFLMTVQELATAVREELDFTLVIINNYYMGMVRQWQELFSDERYAESELPHLPEFDKIAEAFGAKGWRLTESENVGEVLEEALEYDGPSVIDAVIDPNENVFPMVPAGSGNDEFIMGKGTQGSRIS
ncbi:MAG: acetolactate synthase-1/2/3 large subunit [Methanobacteriota archaeon]|jgi:acetolactate synthase-1/2/3 large subunit|uniref:Acetolactate synthase n=1 Tax=Halorutilus salinus TaxID=2487751 RepID=A0A9Q4C4B2_9EURY|nr:biosynthetic-type acetolactate synthase large subunit [Halorutilus salinus]MCX2819612.1 biosynthetic-type acetolactate synthase large subunit [Halorutilus salinus]